MVNNKTISAIITAAGSSSRFGHDKLLTPLNRKPLLLNTLGQFCKSDKIDEIVVAVKKANIDNYKKIIKSVGIRAKLVEGGRERIISANNALIASKGDYVITHDGARPLTPVWLIDKLIEATIKYEAAMTAVIPTATIKYVKKGFVKKSFPRETTLIAQTPQGFKREIILRAFKKAIDEKYFIATDDSELVTRLGIKVRVVLGDEINIKITYTSDLVIAEQLLGK